MRKTESVSPLKYDSVDFMVYVPPSSTSSLTQVESPAPVSGQLTAKRCSLPQGEPVFKAVIECTGTDNYDVITVIRSAVMLERKRGTETSCYIEYHRLDGRSDGWEELSLVLVEKYQLLDGQGKSWLPPNILNDCAIEKVSLRSGQFIRYCHKRTPAWTVSTENSTDIPLSYNAVNGLSRQHLSLIAQAEFKPSFVVSGKTTVLGWDNNSIIAVQSSHETVRPPLPPFKWHWITLLLTEDARTATLKVR